MAIGLSLDAAAPLRRFFRSVQPGPAMGYVLALQTAGREAEPPPGALARRIGTPLRLATDHAPIEAGQAYLVPRGAEFALIAGRFERRDPTLHPELRSPVDALFSALAIDQGENGAGVLLSRVGHQGIFGLRAIKENGGLALLASDAGGTPLGAASACIDFLVPPEAMPERLGVYFQTRKHRRCSAALCAGTRDPRFLSRICTAVSLQTGYDLSDYARDTLARRIARRMNMLGITEPARFAALLDRDSREGALLRRDLLISVTNFFREPPAFAALARDVIPRLWESAEAGANIRVWIPGCASGEEAYSLAILLAEETERRGDAPGIAILATDMKEDALAIARAARYPTSIAADLSPGRLERFFVYRDGAYSVAERVRKSCHFARHDLLRDTPPLRIALISCRNLLVHLRPEAQARVLRCFYRALLPGGYLFLGAPDPAPCDSRLFSALDETHRIFRRSRHPNPAH